MIVKTQKDEKLELCKGLEFVCSRRKDHNGFAGKVVDGELLALCSIIKALVETFRLEIRG